ncbi:dihydroxyacetone kinase phosphoryl donor subunit DhaM [Gleimia sp. 6138-11-ORH1]|uniref:dihydroxyacetone kinase phosphoryl donor subunit DhaM n=1 Tax=Gleimia sp. 6138-11-ORH1 TaxID=2973937 RepID=UPI0021674D5A|nr:dihydroxyacetone kinase phosphoryl donor subunit DhaM [Gleimia sp. 6138-11-ORH1]MCS4484877.1 dihydroxyacetone kinase phosphoryl donor subunit DhaM [Gleimia sp. 6138-11-ORH1]
MAKPVSLVLVSHSAKLAEGLAEVAAQMAPDVLILAAGGNDEGGIGTSFDKIDAAVTEAIATSAVVILSDLGSATMTVENVLEFLGDDNAQWIDGPLVEGAVLAAVAAQQDGDLETVLNAVKEATLQWDYREKETGAEATPSAKVENPIEIPAGAVSAQVVLADPDGLHARPAAMVARTVAGVDAQVTINGVDARSVLALMGLGTKGGDTVTIVATGNAANSILEAVVKELG